MPIPRDGSLNDSGTTRKLLRKHRDYFQLIFRFMKTKYKISTVAERRGPELQPGLGDWPTGIMVQKRGKFLFLGLGET